MNEVFAAVNMSGLITGVVAIVVGLIAVVLVMFVYGIVSGVLYGKQDRDAAGIGIVFDPGLSLRERDNIISEGKYSS